MADGDKQDRRRLSLLGTIQQWQVVVTLIGAGVALLYGCEDRRREQLALNRTAVEAAKEEGSFFADPYNTLVEYQATFPEHAYCAALGTFLAEVEREDAARSETVPVSQLNKAVDAVSGRLEVLLQKAGIDEDTVTSAAARFAGTGDTHERCAFAEVELDRLAVFSLDQDCRQLIQTYTQSECVTKRAEILTAANPPPESEPLPPPDRTIFSNDRERRAFLPPESCGAPPPMLYLQITGESGRGAATRLQAALRDAGWSVPDIELVADGQASNGVRYYTEAQKDCAQWLAGALTGWSGSGKSFDLISLAGRYRKLPSDQMEVWLAGE